LSDAALSQEQINGFMACLFDKGAPTARPDNLPLPFSSDNPPSLIRTSALLNLYCMVTNVYFCLVTQDHYPECQVDVDVSDEDNNGLKEPVGDDAGGVGAPSVETFAPNLIRSSTAETPHPSAADQTITTTPSGSGQKRKRVALGTKCKQDKPLAD
jgi:hypothetical protein